MLHTSSPYFSYEFPMLLLISFFGLSYSLGNYFGTYLCFSDCFKFLNTQIYHTENTCTPFSLLSLVNAWKTDASDTVTTTPDATTNETGSSPSLSEMSKEVSCQLHSGIMKAARRIVLDEIISTVIAEFAAMKKSWREVKHEPINQVAETCSLDRRMVMCTNS